jgi:hypothetical protein
MYMEWTHTGPIMSVYPHDSTPEQLNGSRWNLLCITFQFPAIGNRNITHKQTCGIDTSATCSEPENDVWLNIFEKYNITVS